MSVKYWISREKQEQSLEMELAPEMFVEPESALKWYVEPEVKPEYFWQENRTGTAPVTLEPEPDRNRWFFWKSEPESNRNRNQVPPVHRNRTGGSISPEPPVRTGVDAGLWSTPLFPIPVAVA